MCHSGAISQDPKVKFAQYLPFLKNFPLYKIVQSNYSHELSPPRLQSVLSREQISNGRIISKYIPA